MARADVRTNEYLARRVQESAERAAAVSSPAGGSSSLTVGRSGPAPSQGGHGGREVRAEPASAGVEPP
eukprot:14468104-Alexandrium_andersonii.AAC.1